MCLQRAAHRQHGVVLRPATSEAAHDRRAAKRAVTAGTSALVSRPLKVADSRVAWQQPRSSQKQVEGDEADRRVREHEKKKKEEATRPSLFQGVLSKLLKPFDDGEEVATEKGGLAESIETEMPAGGVVFSRDVKPKESDQRRRSTKSGQLFRRSASALADDGRFERPPPCAIDFAQAAEHAERRRARALQNDEELARRARRSSGAISRVSDRQEERQPGRGNGEDVRERRKSSLLEKQKFEDDGTDVRDRPDVLRRVQDSRPSVVEAGSRDRYKAGRRVSKESAPRSADVEYPEEKGRVYDDDDEGSHEDVPVVPPRRKSSFSDEKLRARPVAGRSDTRDPRAERSEVPRRKSGFGAAEPDWETKREAERIDRAPEEPLSTPAKDYADPKSRRPWAGVDQSPRREETEPESTPPSVRDDESVSDARSAWADDASEVSAPGEEPQTFPGRRSTSNGRVKSFTASVPAPRPESPFLSGLEPRQKEPEGLARRFASRTIASPFVQSVAPSPVASPRAPISRQVSAAFLGAVESPLPSARSRSPRPPHNERRHRSSRAREDSDRRGGGVWRSPSRTLASPLASARGSYAGAVGLGAPRRMLSVASRGDWDDNSPRGGSVYGDRKGADSARPQVSPLDLSRIRR